MSEPVDDQKIHPVRLQEMEAGDADPKAQRWIEKNLQLIKDVKIGVTAVLGGTSIPVSRLFDLKEGEVLTLDTLVDEPVAVMVEGKTVARGQLVVAGDAYGIRIDEILSGAL